MIYKVCAALCKTTAWSLPVLQIQAKAGAARHRSDTLRERVKTIQALNEQIQLNAAMSEVVQSAVRPEYLP